MLFILHPGKQYPVSIISQINKPIQFITKTVFMTLSCLKSPLLCALYTNLSHLTTNSFLYVLFCVLKITSYLLTPLKSVSCLRWFLFFVNISVMVPCRKQSPPVSFECKLNNIYSTLLLQIGPTKVIFGRHKKTSDESRLT